MRLPIDVDRLRADIEANAQFGALDTDDPNDHGRTNRTGSEANRAARDHLVERMEAAGLSVSIDEVGNIVGQWCPDTVATDVAPVASGSHLDSVPEGGIFDGPLGVYAALEAVRALQEATVAIDRPILVVSFTEEEGATYGNGLVGSTAAAGLRSVSDTLALSNNAGETLGAALDRIGYRGDGIHDPSAWNAFFELHIEQDTRLESVGIPVGIVTTISGITHGEVTIVGEANHAGATPMNQRTDALAAASEFVLDIEAAANAVVDGSSPSAVGTVGAMTVQPNATNVVPGRVEMGIDIRDIHQDSIQTIVDAARTSLQRIAEDRMVRPTLRRTLDVEPTPMSERLRKFAHEAVDDTDSSALDLHSGAAHDTMRVAAVTDAALLFAPSRNGISHSPREWTDWDDCAEATTVLAGALAKAAAVSE